MAADLTATMPTALPHIGFGDTGGIVALAILVLNVALYALPVVLLLVAVDYLARRYSPSYRATSDKARAQVAVEAARVAASLPKVGEDGVRFAAPEGLANGWLVSVHADHIERRKRRQLDPAPEVIALRAVTSVKTTDTTVTLTLQNGQRDWTFDRHDAAKLARVLADDMAARG